MIKPRYFARSASDRTDDWPLWFVADRHQSDLNVTVRLVPSFRGYMPFLPREAAELVADRANGAAP